MNIIYRFSLAVTVGLSLGLLLSFSGTLREPVSHDNDIYSTQEEILGAIQNKYIKKINHDDFSNLNVEEIFSSLDRYSEYLSETQYKKIVFIFSDKFLSTASGLIIESVCCKSLIIFFHKLI